MGTNQHILLEDLAQQSNVIYFDTSVLSMDRDQSAVLLGRQFKRKDLPDFSEILGKARNLRMLDERHLRHQFSHAHGLASIFQSHYSCAATPLVLGEYVNLVQHLQTCYHYHQKHTRSPFGKKMRLLQAIVHLHKKRYAILSGRLQDHEYLPVEEIVVYANQKRLHAPRGAWFVKSTRAIEETPSKADVEVMAYAIFKAVEGMHVSVVTGDLDIANLIFNYGQQAHTNNVPMSLAGFIDVYFPNKIGWTESLQLYKMTDTEGFIAPSELRKVRSNLQKKW